MVEGSVTDNGIVGRAGTTGEGEADGDIRCGGGQRGVSSPLPAHAIRLELCIRKVISSDEIIVISPSGSRTVDDVDGCA